jgi:serine protease Do
MKAKYSVWRLVLLILSLLLASPLSAGCRFVERSQPEITSVPFTEAIDEVTPSVVFILMESVDSEGRQVFSTGSGVILRSDGYILTNRHVVDGAQRIEVTLQDRRTYETTGIWLDDVLDLAMIKIDAADLPVAQFGDPDSIIVGHWVIAIGHPLGMSPQAGGATVTVGIVSNLGRSFNIGSVPYYDVIQTDAAINPGNSGGPLVNLQGEVIGINSAGTGEAQNINYAINVRTARRVFEDLLKFGRVQRPYLGVNLSDITPSLACEYCLTQRVGSVIINIEPDGPAALAGLQENDVIVLFGEREITSTVALIKEIWSYRADDTVKVIFWRGNEEMETVVTLKERPE